MSVTVPTLEVERGLAARCGPGRQIIVGIDEVGRGALAGPVAVGACAIEIIDGSCPPLPDGIRDSKSLTAKRRAALVRPILDNVHAGAVGWADAAEIDEIGIMAALTTAAVRALDSLAVTPDAILLDGNVDFLSAALAGTWGQVPPVELRVGADRDCLSAAAASVLAKVARDDHMVQLHKDAPDFAWASNKGYGSAAHRAAIERHGPHRHHRRSWRLGGAAATPAPRRAVAFPAAAPLPAPSGAGVLWGDQITWMKEERR